MQRNRRVFFRFFAASRLGARFSSVLSTTFLSVTLTGFLEGIEKNTHCKGIIAMLKSSRWPVIVLLIIIGASLRILHLGKASPWLDEAITYDRALASVPDIIKASYGWDIHPPTYYVISHYMVQFGHSPEALRLFSVICGVLSIPIFYFLAREIFGRKREAAVATLLLVLSAYQIRYAQEARMYTLFFLVSLFALLFFYRAFKRQQKRDWFLWAGFSIINFYVHYFAIFLMASQVVFYLIHLIQTKTLRQLFKQHRIFLWASLLMMVGCLPAVPLLIQQATTKINSYGVKQPTVNPLMFVLVFLKYSFYPNTLAEPLWERGLKYIFGAFTFFGAIIAWKQRRNMIIFCATIIVISLALGWLVSHIVFFSLTFRYLYFLNAPMLLLLALAVTAVVDKIKPGSAAKKTLALATVLGAICMLDAYILANYYENPREPDWRAGFSHIKQNCRENEVIVPVPGYVTYVARYYLAGDEKSKKVLWLDDTSPAALESLLDQHEGVFFVLTDDMYPPERRQTVDFWLVEHGRLLWEDPNFPRNVIWYSTKTSPIGMNELESHSQ
jgi:4-amino-4-deoxy-L-arabinose transferase-like glycosyltransferase